MTRVVLWLVPVAVLLGAQLGARLQPVAAFLVSLVLGVAVTGFLWARQRRRVDQLAGQINSWLGLTTHRPVALEGGQHWADLAIAINAVGAAFHRRGLRLAEAQPRMSELVDALPEPALLFSGTGRLAAVNDPGRRLFGVASEPLSVTQALGLAEAIALVEAAMADRQRHRGEAGLGERDLSMVAGPLGDHTLLLVADLTQQRRTEELRRDFVSNASHELKTPVAGIQALSDAIDVTLADDPQRARRLLAQLRAEADRMASLVHDLLSLRRLEERGRRTTDEVVDLSRVVRDELAAAADAADQRSVTLSLEAEVDAVVHGSLDDLRLVVGNLVDNAIKYNREGGRVDVHIERQGADVVLHVRDTGIGIPRQDTGRVFERFYRVDEGRSREAGGTGLGLSIVRNAVERQGGSVSVESLLSVGTTFTVRLPAADSAAADAS